MIKKRWIALYFLMLLLPYLALLSLGHFLLPKTPQEEAPIYSGITINLYKAEKNKFVTLALKDYLWGVLAGEMPASYPKEALKAQVVASYSYLLHRQKMLAEHPGQNFGHDGDICDNPAHCKACLLPQEAAIRFGEDWLKENGALLEEAVSSVLGEALIYQQEPVNAVFHAMSGGQTEDAKDVWGAAVPYLQSVDSHWDEQSKDFLSERSLPLSEFKKTLGQTDCSLGATTLTQGGSVATMVIGGKAFTGRELRALFGLRSTRFTLEIAEDSAIFKVSGYGHQVGMSQHGASILAEEGYSYQEILYYYYSDTTLAKDYYPTF